MEPKIRILIVEDEALIAENLKLTLEDLGYEVAGTCYTYAEALQAFRTTAADLVMLDINLSSKNASEDGLALAAMLRNEGGKQFVFLTAYNDLDTIRQAAKLQPSGYLIKPVNAAAVFATIQTALEKGNAAPPDTTPVPRPDYFFVRMGARNIKVMWDDIYCIEAGKNYVKLRSAAMKVEYPIRGTLTFVMEQLLPARLTADFLRVSRSICLNRKFITAYSNDWIYCGEEQFENTRFASKDMAALLNTEI